MRVGWYAVALSAMAAASGFGAPTALARGGVVELEQPIGVYEEPAGPIRDGGRMFDYGEVRLAGRQLTGRQAACEEYLDATVLANGTSTAEIAFTHARTDEYCEGQMTLLTLPRLQYASNGMAKLVGRFEVELGELGCTYTLEKLSSTWARRLQVAMAGGHARRRHENAVHGSCPRTVSAAFYVYGAYEFEYFTQFYADSGRIVPG